MMHALITLALPVLGIAAFAIWALGKVRQQHTDAAREIVDNARAYAQEKGFEILPDAQRAEVIADTAAALQTVSAIGTRGLVRCKLRVLDDLGLERFVIEIEGRAFSERAQIVVHRRSGRVLAVVKIHGGSGRGRMRAA